MNTINLLITSHCYTEIKKEKSKHTWIFFFVSPLNFLEEHIEFLVCSHNIFSFNQVCHLSWDSRRLCLFIFYFLKLQWIRLGKIIVDQWKLIKLIKKRSGLDISQWALDKLSRGPSFWGFPQSCHLQDGPVTSEVSCSDSHLQLGSYRAVWPEGSASVVVVLFLACIPRPRSPCSQTVASASTQQPSCVRARHYLLGSFLGNSIF